MLWQVVIDSNDGWGHFRSGDPDLCVMENRLRDLANKLMPKTLLKYQPTQVIC